MRRLAALLHGEKAPAGAVRLPAGKLKLQIAALGDVGSHVLLGLRLLGGDVLSSIGIYDISRENTERYVREMRQIRYPQDEVPLPAVFALKEEALFDCHVFLLCASMGVPPLSAAGDVRMAQLAANAKLAEHYAALAKARRFSGLVGIVSDPVDPLCSVFLAASGCAPAQVKGYGLGVMNARARAIAEENPRFAAYLSEGRAFGPHGEQLVLANSLTRYDHALSKELTALVTEENKAIRALGYKPYLGPAFSSAALSVLLTLRGAWQYSSLYLGDAQGGAFLGVRNRLENGVSVYEDEPLPDALFARVQAAYEELRALAAGGTGTGKLPAAKEATPC